MEGCSFKGCGSAPEDILGFGRIGFACFDLLYLHISGNEAEGFLIR